MKKKVSLKDIAQKVGVSIALVSYVLNGKREGTIGKEVSQKIKQAASDLNYRPNQVAKSLRTNKSNTIGLIVADISNPFFSNLARIIEDEADKNGYTVIFGSSDEKADRSWKLMNTLLDRQVDGFIITAASNTEDHIRYLQEHDIPFVLVDRYFPDIKTNYISLDNYKAAYIATEYLAQSGYKRIGMVTYESNLLNLEERQRGYLDAIKTHELAYKKSWLKQVLPDDGNIKSTVEKAVHELISLPEPVDAILFASNILALNGLKYIHALKMRIPDDIAIVNFDEMEAADLFYAPPTYIKQPLLEMGQTATRILLENISKNNKITQINMDPELVIRQPVFSFAGQE